ncbi:MAG: transglycosylase SLT domain-containing protein [Gemmobacter sp.]
MIRRLVFPLLAILLLALPARADEAAALRAALDAAAARDWEGAALEARAAGAVGAEIVEWMRLRAGQGRLGDYEVFLRAHPDWPGLALLHQKGEEAAARSDTPERVIAYFAADRASTPEGAMALIAALRATGRAEDAAAEARRVWVEMDFSGAEQTAFLTLAGDSVARAHAARTDRLLWDRAPKSALRMLPLLSPDQRRLAEARIALQAGGDGVNALIAAVPADLQSDPGLAHDRFQWRMDNGLYDSAAELILERSAAVEGLGDPAAWAKRRASLARELAERGQPRLAYRVAASHNLQGGADHADLEFLAGFIALRQLDDARAAKAHFVALRAVVKTGISLSRAHYWEGRAAEVLGEKDAATAAYRAAAVHSSAYYGLLAAERLGQPLDAALLSDARPADWRQAPFARSSVLTAARLFLRAGDRANGKRFMLHLAQSLDASGIAQLADLALSMGEPHVALVLAKAAAERGAILPRYYYPLVGLVPDGLLVSRALALAIARRESEFDPAVVSGAGAMGLMQVMPGTAKDMAAQVGVPYAKGRLTTDPAYNVTLGSAYLRQLIDEFGPAVALVAAGYNAGPTRPRRWITAFGDPRSPSVDVVDWVEQIPIGETRTYVMRVSESLVIYRARLKGAVGPVNLTGELTGR